MVVFNNRKRFYIIIVLSGMQKRMGWSISCFSEDDFRLDQRESRRSFG